MTAPHLRALPARIGGLMRCCLETLDTTPVVEEEGTILPCKYCPSTMIVRDGAWEWNQGPRGRYDVMAKAKHIGHCLCNLKQTCPCPTLLKRNICRCAGEFDETALPEEGAET